MFFLRRLIKQFLVVLVLGFVIRKLLESADPRAQRVGRIANRLTGSRYIDQTRQQSSGRRRLVKGRV